MWPILISHDYVTIYTYGVFLALGFIACDCVVRKLSLYEGVNQDIASNIAFWSMAIGFIGGRFLFIIIAWNYFSQNLVDIFKFWNGGSVFYGGLITGIGVIVFLSDHYRLSPMKALDIGAPAVSIAHSFGRLGCFAAGCCYGRPISEDHPFAVIFTNPDIPAPVGMSLHPTQLYDSFNSLFIFLALMFIYKHKRFDGQIIGVYAILYALGRSIIEIYRGDYIRGFIIQDVVSTSQLISFFVIIITLVTMISKRYHPQILSVFTKSHR